MIVWYTLLKQLFIPMNERYPKTHLSNPASCKLFRNNVVDSKSRRTFSKEDCDADNDGKEQW